MPLNFLHNLKKRKKNSHSSFLLFKNVLFTSHTSTMYDVVLLVQKNVCFAAANIPSGAPIVLTFVLFSHPHPRHVVMR